MSLDVGEVPTFDSMGGTEGDDPERLTRIVARIVARAGDRVGFVRKFSRHFEGQDKRSGLLSDVAAAVTELYRRNPEAFEKLGKEAATNFNARRAQRAAEKETPTNGGMTNAPR